MKNRIILITGRIGSGKSAVASVIRRHHHCEVGMDGFSKMFLGAKCCKKKLVKLFSKEVLQGPQGVRTCYEIPAFPWCPCRRTA